jgi:hypothetical protein
MLRSRTPRRCAVAIPVLLAGWALAPVAATAQATAAVAPAAAAPVVLPLEPYVAGLRTLTVELAGRPSKLIFDTAGGITLITPAHAAALGCQPFGRLTGFRHNGDPVHATRCGPLALAAGAHRAHREVAVWDLMSLLGGAPPVDGLAGLDLFEGAALTIDFAAGELVVETPASLAERVRGAARLEIRLARQAGGAALDLFVAARSPQGTLWLEWDSGNVGPVRLAPHAVRQLGWELSQETASPRELDIAGLGLVALEAIEHEMIYDGLLNNRFFQEHVFTLDLARGELWARRHAAAE